MACGIVLYAGVMLSTRMQLILAFLRGDRAGVLRGVDRAGRGRESRGRGVQAEFVATGDQWGVLRGVVRGVVLQRVRAAANLGEETAHPKRDVPRAVMISILAVAGFYVVGAYAQVAGYRFRSRELGKTPGRRCSGWPGRPRPVVTGPS